MKHILFSIVALAILFSAANASSFRSYFLRHSVQDVPAAAPSKNHLTPEEIDDMIQAFLTGADIEKYFKDSSKCAESASDLTVDMFYSDQAIKKHGWTVDTYFNFTKSMQGMTPFIRDCYSASNAAVDAIHDHFTQFKNFANFVGSFFQNFVNRMLDLKGCYDAIIEAGDNKTEVAFQYGRMVMYLLDFEPLKMPRSVALAKPEPQDLAEQIATFVYGFLNGTKLLVSPNTTACYNEFSLFDKEVEEVIVDFQKNNRESAFLNLADLFYNVYPTSFSCYYGTAELTAIVQEHAQIFDHPNDILMHIVSHFSESFNDIRLAIEYLKKDDYGKAGEALGDFAWIMFFIDE